MLMKVHFYPRKWQVALQGEEIQLDIQNEQYPGQLLSLVHQLPLAQQEWLWQVIGMIFLHSQLSI